MDSSERGMNSVAMTIINAQIEYWPNRGLNQKPPDLKLILLTELWGLGSNVEKKLAKHWFNSLPNDKLLDWSKLKAIADVKINVTEKLKFVLGRVENTGKGENAGHQHFLHSL